VRLDDGRFTRTDDRGRFRFERVARGARRVEVALPEGAYFTTPSAVEVSGGREAAFGLASTPARLYGSVCDEGGRGIEACPSGPSARCLDSPRSSPQDPRHPARA